ncbi:uncharacterized protein LOC128602308 [Ictalurus furcatus]|uniref:uncharacterized protein LOC128602308 n=1 Tax=Ictalurus furcatus TaxID=66913 RepID=UPI002350F537|nr:uncharacterized protein LOC128602308 [Ictalurus furcatus]XP_053472011.1 uncharacterized protein LOC128602308 [Ictalurus furcatus]XP_053472012.1 uncharacterized protein LOC128602308 [Ictalurus furcatus]XP_053472013.1 uncharacterized protein LOC128602308 [Ictalurus furcatus]XP_053472014.1 uncharacterized protein LOC128602308 [Ictalurus furcatus]XP_053472015.1 uncharacterized protein LOC128602308 [Ictalurus furcatus]
MGVTGHSVLECFSEPLVRECENEKRVTQKFLISSSCPVNLLGRDLMCVLHLNLMSSPQGVTINDDSSLGTPFVRATELCVYQWSKHNKPRACARLLTLAHDKMKDNYVDFMLSSALHCTVQVHEERDFNFEKEWFMDIPESEELYLYWCDKFCACPVKLNDTQLRVFFVPESAPHVSLAKIKNKQWKDVGLWVKLCESERITVWDHEPTSNIWYSPTLGVYKKLFQEMCKVNRDVLCHDKGMFLNLGTSPTPLETHPQLKKVPLGLWAQGKHDVGLIRSAPPLVITPKSDFRPRQSQYPLKSEAIEGVRPVFNSLLKAGVIVPCPDSLVCTPIFPV